MIVVPRVDAEVVRGSFGLESEALAKLVQGPIMTNLVKRALRVEAAAKGFASGRGGGPQVRTGRLRGSITWRPGVDAVSPYVDIGTNVFYAPFVEEGHKNTPHVYPIMTAGGNFTGQFGVVSSRPTPAYPFLKPALAAAYTT